MPDPRYDDTMESESLHGVNAPGTWKLQLTFRGSRSEDKRLALALKARADQDGTKYADVIREALKRYLGLQ